MNQDFMLSEKVQSMQESATLRMAKKGRELASKGVKVISLSLGEPDFDTPQHIKDAATEGLAKGYTKYTPVTGLPMLKKAIVEKLKRDNGVEYAENQIIVSNGAKQTIANICLALLNEGDEAIIFAPYWVSYVEIVKFCGGTPIVINSGINQDFKVTPDQLEKAITPKTKMVIYSSPCNPSGSVFTAEELNGIAEVVKKHENILVVSDEIYEHINFTGKHASISSIDGMKDITAVVNGFAKGYSMTGWRLGYMAGPQWLVNACDKVQGQITSGASSFGQYAAAIALDSDHKPTHDMVVEFHKRRDLIIDLFSKIPGIKVNRPTGAFYLFPDVSYYFGRSNGIFTIKDADEFCELVLSEAHVACVSGAAFGDENCIRISYAASEEDLRTAVKNIADFLATFK
jgi:aspartate aminotransferase